MQEQTRQYNRTHDFAYPRSAPNQFFKDAYVYITNLPLVLFGLQDFKNYFPTSHENQYQNSQSHINNVGT